MNNQNTENNTGLKAQISKIEADAIHAFDKATTVKDLYDQKVAFMGKQGGFSLLMREFGKLPPAEKPAMGQFINEAKSRVEAKYQSREGELKRAELNQKIASEKIDLSLPGPASTQGTRHPLRIVINEVVEILSHIGFSVRQGPLIEKDLNNFTKLNFPEGHPSRDLQDTFYIDDNHVLRTHTSPVQVRTMESEKPPIRVLAPGSVFRCDSDTSHSPNFHQIEGLYIDRKVSMADLRGTLNYFVQGFLGKGLKTRFRPSFFPFTEPSAEFDCQCPLCKGSGCRMCKQSGWIEIGGAGLVNPRVIEHCGLDPQEWQGFAFGFGIERMAIIKYGIGDIRLFSENDVRFLRQFEM